VDDHGLSVQDPKRTIIETAVGVFFFSDQSIAARYIEITVRDIEVRKFLTEKCKSILAVLFQRIGGDHYEIGPYSTDLSIILLQRSSHAGCSVGVILVTVLAHENKFLITFSELTQKKFPVRCFNKEFRSLFSNLRPFRLSAHNDPPKTEE
jgi:hypothetical protein